MIVAFMVPAPRVRTGNYRWHGAYVYIIPRSNPARITRRHFLAIHCPYCQYGFPIQVEKPGRFGARCPKCARTFAVTVPVGPDPKLLVTPLKSEVGSIDGGGANPASEPAADVKK